MLTFFSLPQRVYQVFYSVRLFFAQTDRFRGLWNLGCLCLQSLANLFLQKVLNKSWVLKGTLCVLVLGVSEKSMFQVWSEIWLHFGAYFGILFYEMTANCAIYITPNSQCNFCSASQTIGPIHANYVIMQMTV